MPPGRELRGGRPRRSFRPRDPDGRPWVGRWWMGTGSLVDFTSAASAPLVAPAGARRCSRLGVEGIKGGRRRGLLPCLPGGPVRRRAPRCAEVGWAYGELYRRTMQRALDEVHPEGVLFGRSGWSGQQATGVTSAGDQASDFWSLRALVTAP